jgi:uncharacterized protein YcfL
MKKALVVIATLTLLVVVGCGKTKTVSIYTESKMITGEQMSCIFHLSGTTSPAFSSNQQQVTGTNYVA